MIEEAWNMRMQTKGGGISPLTPSLAMSMTWTLPLGAYEGKKVIRRCK